MSRQSSDREVEIKLALASPEDGLRRLQRSGFRLARPRVFESNTVFDDEAGRLRQAGTLLRVRQVDGMGILTYKGPAAPGRHKDREELEVEFSGPATIHVILERLGFSPAFRYEKYRAEYTDGAGTATLDETPIGTFLELEGEPAWIDAAAVAMGFSEADYITASYLRLYLEEQARRGLPAGDMVFPAEKG